MKARPMRRATSAWSWAGYRPRTSYALKMDASIMAPSVGTGMVRDDRALAETGARSHDGVAADAHSGSDEGALHASVFANGRTRPQDAIGDRGSGCQGHVFDEHAHRC